MSYARANFKNTPAVIQHLELEMQQKGAVAAGTTSDATWGGNLAQPSPLASEFTELLRGLSVLPRLAVRKMPFNTRFVRSTSGTSANWVGQGLPAPVSKMDFEALTLGYSKLVSICVITGEVAHNPSLQAAQSIAADIAAVVAEMLDRSFLDPDRAAVVDVSPASITHGAPQFQSSGNTFANVVADLAKLMDSLATSPGVRLRDAVWIIPERVAAKWQTLTNTNSAFCFGDLGPAGGTLLNLPALTCGELPSGNSPTEDTVILLSPSLIAVADDGAMAVDVAINPALQMLDNPITGATSNVSLWQENLVGIKLTRFASWLRRREGCVAVLRGINL